MKFQYMHAKILDWIDGDTVQVEIDFGFGVRYVSKLRIAHIDTPEKADGEAAKRFAITTAPPGTQIVLETVKSGQDRYGRILADFQIDGLYMSKRLVDVGFAVPYEGGKKSVTS